LLLGYVEAEMRFSILNVASEISVEALKDVLMMLRSGITY
jgi:hypothetical protein